MIWDIDERSLVFFFLMSFLIPNVWAGDCSGVSALRSKPSDKVSVLDMSSNWAT